MPTESTSVKMEAVSLFSSLLFLQIIVFISAGTTLVRMSVPEKYRVTINCSGYDQRDASQVVWTHGDTEVIRWSPGNTVTNLNRYKYDLLSGGALWLDNVQLEDSGLYYCNKRIVADVQILTGDDYDISAGRTLLLPCRNSEKLRQMWMFRKDKWLKRKLILQKFRNGTVMKELDDPHNRFSQVDNKLKITNLQPEDAGLYFCNSQKVATLNVMPDTHEHNHEVTTDETDTKMEDSEDGDQEPKSVLRTLMVGFCVVIPLAAAIAIVIGIAVKRKKTGERGGPEQLGFLDKDRDANTEPVMEGSDVHYASLGHQDWTERPGVQERHQQVIYSSVVQGLP